MLGLSERQKKWVAAGVTSVAVAIVCTFVVGIFWGLLKIVDLASPALIPVFMGILLAMFFKPYFGWFLKRLQNPTLAFIAMALTVLVPAGLILWIVGIMMVEQISAFFAAAPTIVTRASEWCRTQIPGLHDGLVQLGVSGDMLLFFNNPTQFSHEVISDLGSQYGIRALKASFSVVRYFTWLIGGLVTLIFFVHFLMKPEVHGKDCVKQLTFLKESTRNFVAAQIDSFFEIIVTFLQRQVVICLIEGALYGLGFMLVGMPYGFVIGFLLGVINLVPLLGTVCCLPVALLLAFFGDDGSILRLIGVTCVWACGQFADGYAITPLIQGNRTGLGFAGVIFSFVFWSAVFQSFLGLLLAIPLSAFCLVLWRAVKERYIKEVI
jgi:predicted PurR-regulated permease PerM